MSKILDNEHESVASALSEVLPHASRLDACVGYFNLRGWGHISNSLHQIQGAGTNHPKVRLLVGMAMGADQEIRKELGRVWSKSSPEQISLPNAMDLARRAVESFAQQLTWGLPTGKDRQGLLGLLEDLESGFVEVKFYARYLLHAKLYVTHLGEGAVRTFRGVVGSSNLTNAGMQSQGELNLEETDLQLTTELSQWFDSKWDDQFAITVNEELVEAIRFSWATPEQPAPRLIHLKMAYVLSHEARAGLTTEIAPQFAGQLLEYQENAVKVGLKMLEQRGLVVIGDVVGLGKTMIGSAIAASRGLSTLVICPKNLVTMWEGYFARFHIPGKVMSISMALNDLPELRHYGLVVIDEAHRLRNRNTKSWRAVNEYIQRGNSEVVLMTATMYNAYYQDISGQIGLKIPFDQPLGIRPEKLIHERGVIEVAKKTGGSLDTLGAFDLSSHNEDWQQLLSLFLIRRTRKFVETNFGEKRTNPDRVVMKYPNGIEYAFPKRRPLPLDYVGGPNDPGDRLASVDNFDTIYALTYARYRLGAYLKPEDAAFGLPQSEIIDDLRKSINSYSGFIRTTALKRLTSSAQAFLLTLERMLLRGYVLEHALTHGLPVPIGTLTNAAYEVDDASLADDADLLQAEEGFEGTSSSVSGAFGGRLWARGRWLAQAEAVYESLTENQPRGIRWADPEWFDTETLLGDLRSDSEDMQKIIDEHGDWNPEEDTKLRALADFVDALPSGKKALVFSEYKDTVDYVFTHLPGLVKNKRIESVSGGSAHPEDLARRFAPIANKELGEMKEGEEEIDVLIATDVLSEGQNLQDSDTVINWDLPWTIIKMIQRAGRVDRVGQQSERISVYSFRSQEGLEELLQLRKRLSERLKNNAAIFGAGEKFFDDDQVVDDDVISGLFDGTAELDLDEGDVDYPSFAFEIWRNATDQEKEATLRLRDSVFSTTLANDFHHTGTLAYFVTDSGYNVISSHVDGAVKSLGPITALRATDLSPDEDAKKLRDEFFEELGAIAESTIANEAGGNFLAVNAGVRKRLYDGLISVSERADLDNKTRTAIAELIDDLVESPITEDSTSFVLSVLKMSKNLKDGVDGLGALLERHRDGKLLKKLTETERDVRMICAMGFI